VADSGVFLAAHDCHPLFADSCLQAPDRIEKRGILCDTEVEHMAALIVEALVVRPSAEFAAEEPIADSLALHRRLQLFAIEVCHVPGIRVGADVDQDLYAMCDQQRDEGVLRLV